MNQHFLQSTAWQKYQELEGHQTFRLSDDNFDCLAVLQSTPLGNYLFCPYGPTLNLPADASAAQVSKSLRAAINALKTLASEQNAFFLRLEPTLPFSASLVKSLNLKKSHDLDPAHTWLLDLTQPEEAILQDIEKRKVRHWRNSSKKGMSIRTSTNPEDITILTSLLNSLGDRNGFIPQNEQHLKNQLQSGFATLYILNYLPPETDTTDTPTAAKAPEKPASSPTAAALIYDRDGTRFYAHAAADPKYQKLAPGTVLLVQMILDAKRGQVVDHPEAQNAPASTFDFWGITTSEDKNHPWYGFTQYKKSFGGYQVDYAGTYDLPLDRKKYAAYQLLRKLNRLKRKLKH